MRDSLRKRMFDLAVAGASMPVWLPVVASCAVAIYLAEGRPVFYSSRRLAYRRQIRSIAKFRTMARNAERLANRDTVPIDTTCFLNISTDSSLYTRVGRILERCALTELPQLWHVLAGHMSLVGNRPLPENVMAALLKQYPYADERLSVRAGLTGPVQLVGRDNISDHDRLALEIGYCIVARSSYAMRLDFMVLLHTVLIALGIEPAMDVAQVRRLMIASARRPQWVCRLSGNDQRLFTRHPSGLAVDVMPPDTRGFSACPAIDVGYGGLSVSRALPLDSVVKLKFAADSASPPFSGRVVWTTEGARAARAGIEFLDAPVLSPSFASQLRLCEPWPSVSGHLPVGTGIA